MFNKKSIALATLAASGALGRSLKQDEDRGLLLAIQKPVIDADFANEELTVSFLTGPSATTGNYTISCFPGIGLTCNTVDPSQTELVQSGDLEKAFTRSEISATFDVTGVEDGDAYSCFIQAEGALGMAMKCTNLFAEFEAPTPAPEPAPPVRSAPVPNRLAGSIIKPATTATGPGTGEVTFETIGAVQYDYLVSCYDKDALDLVDITATCDTDFTLAAVEAAQIAEETGTTSKGKSVTTVDVTVVDETTAQCFVFTQGPLGKMDKCKSAGSALIAAAEPARIAGSIIKPATTATGPGTGEVTFETIGAVQYDYLVSCYDKDALTDADITATCATDFTLAAVEAAQIAEETGTTSKGKSVTTVDLAVTTATTAQCFIFTQGPLGKKDLCKPAGSADIAAPEDRLAGSIIKPETVGTGAGTGEVTFETIGAVQYDYLVSCYDKDALTDADITATCDTDFTLAAVEAAQIAEETGTTSKGKSVTTVDITDVDGVTAQCFIFTQGPLGKMDKCKSAGSAVLEDPAARLAGSIIKPDTIFTGPGALQVSFDTIGPVSYDYLVACYDNSALEDASLTATCKSDFANPTIQAALIGEETGVTPVGKSTTVVGFSNVVASDVRCFVFTAGPLGKKDICKSAGDAVILL